MLTTAQGPQKWPARLQHGQRPQQVGDALPRHFRYARGEVGVQAGQHAPGVVAQARQRPHDVAHLLRIELGAARPHALAQGFDGSCGVIPQRRKAPLRASQMLVQTAGGGCT